MSIAICLISDCFRTSSIFFSWLGCRALLPGTVELALPTLINSITFWVSSVSQSDHRICVLGRRIRVHCWLLMISGYRNGSVRRQQYVYISLWYTQLRIWHHTNVLTCYITRALISLIAMMSCPRFMICSILSVPGHSQCVPKRYGCVCSNVCFRGVFYQYQSRLLELVL